MFMYWIVCVSMCIYFRTHHHSFLPLVQNGLMPLATKDYKDFPLTRSNGDAPCPRVESFVVAITFLRCFNAALHDPANHIIMNWWNRDNKFVGGMRKVPPYTDLF